MLIVGLKFVSGFLQFPEVQIERFPRDVHALLFGERLNGADTTLFAPQLKSELIPIFFRYIQGSCDGLFMIIRSERR